MKRSGPTRSTPAGNPVRQAATARRQAAEGQIAHAKAVHARSAAGRGLKAFALVVLLVFFAGGFVTGAFESLFSQPLPAPTAASTASSLPALDIIAPSPEAQRTAADLPDPMPAEPTTPPMDAVITPTPTPGPVTFALSFAGDCTLGADHGKHGSAYSFIRTVGDDYAYPLANAREYFASDDFTLVNLEGTLTNCNTPREKEFRFRGPPEYAKILTEGGVECVSLANNHTQDYGLTGYRDTQAALDAEGILHVGREESRLVTTEGGLTIGVYAAAFPNAAEVTKRVRALREQEPDVLIAAFHWGVERSYRPNASQRAAARAAVQAGADIVVGHHPHVLQPLEYYKGKPIFYSLGNFAYGGHANPSDRDTAIAQQQVLKHPDGTVVLGQTTLLPFCLSDRPGRNSYRPVRYEPGSAEYERTMAKLSGTYGR